MFRNVLYKSFYAFPRLKAVTPLTRTLKGLGIFDVKKIKQIKKCKKKSLKKSIETGACAFFRRPFFRIKNRSCKEKDYLHRDFV